MIPANTHHHRPLTRRLNRGNGRSLRRRPTRTIQITTRGSSRQRVVWTRPATAAATHRPRPRLPAVAVARPRLPAVAVARPRLPAVAVARPRLPAVAVARPRLPAVAVAVPALRTVGTGFISRRVLAPGARTLIGRLRTLDQQEPRPPQPLRLRRRLRLLRSRGVPTGSTTTKRTNQVSTNISGSQTSATKTTNPKRAIRFGCKSTGLTTGTTLLCMSSCGFRRAAPTNPNPRARPARRDITTTRFPASAIPTTHHHHRRASPTALCTTSCMCLSSDPTHTDAPTRPRWSRPAQPPPLRPRPRLGRFR